MTDSIQLQACLSSKPKNIRVMFDEVPLGGEGGILVQIGHSGGLETSEYVEIARGKF